MTKYPVTKNKEILLFATTWMNFESIMLSEISQTQRDKYFMISLKHSPKKTEFIESERRLVVARRDK